MSKIKGPAAAQRSSRPPVSGPEQSHRKPGAVHHRSAGGRARQCISTITENAAWTYLLARVLYVPAYASGVFLLRSVVFSVGWLATLTMLIVGLFLN